MRGFPSLCPLFLPVSLRPACRQAGPDDFGKVIQVVPLMVVIVTGWLGEGKGQNGLAAAGDSWPGQGGCWRPRVKDSIALLNTYGHFEGRFG